VIAQLLAQEGAKVVLADINAAAGEETTSEINHQGFEAIFVPADISQEAEAKRISDEACQAFRPS